MDEQENSVWLVLDGYTKMLGSIPAFVADREDGESLVDCIDRNYQHGGGWHDFNKFSVDAFNGQMEYLDDPVMHPIAMYETADEVLWMYPYGWVTVLDKSTFNTRTARID